MGIIIKAHCICGFHVDRLFLGGGMYTHLESCGAPALCLECKSLVNPNYYIENARCPKCDGIVVYYNSPELYHKIDVKGVPIKWSLSKQKKDEEYFILYKGNYFCPKCREFNLKFENIGTFD